MVANRTARPISPAETALFGNINRQLGKRKRAYLGDASGVTEVPNNPDITGDLSGYGMYYARWFAGMDELSNAQFGEAFKVKFGTVSFPDRPNLPIWLEQEAASGLYVIVGYDDQVVKQSGIDPRQFNQGSARNYQLVFRMLQNGRTKTHPQSSGNETKITIQDLLYIFDGTVNNAAHGLSDNIDLSSYIPSSVGNEAPVLVGVNPFDNSVEIIKGTEVAVSNNRFAPGTLTTLLDDFSDYTMPLDVYRIPGAIGTLLPSHRDLGVDMRQLINVPRPRGFPIDIDRHIHILSNYQQPFHEQHVDSGTLMVDGLLYEV